VIGNQVGKRSKRRPPEPKQESETAGGLKNAAAREERNGSSHFKNVLPKRIRKKVTKVNESSNMDRRGQLRQRFNGQFGRWEIELPIDAMEPGVVWLIVKRGWTIWTRFDVEDDRERLDYYAMHRMTDDSHVRMYVDGDDVRLPAMSGVRYSKGRHRGGGESQGLHAQPIGSEAAGGEGLRHDKPSPWQRHREPLSADSPGSTGPQRAAEDIGVGETEGDSEWETSKVRK